MELAFKKKRIFNQVVKKLNYIIQLSQLKPKSFIKKI